MVTEKDEQWDQVKFLLEDVGAPPDWFERYARAADIHPIDAYDTFSLVMDVWKKPVRKLRLIPEVPRRIRGCHPMLLEMDEVSVYDPRVDDLPELTVVQELCMTYVRELNHYRPWGG